MTIAGRTESANWPYGPAPAGGADVFVARLAPGRAGNAQLLWCTPIRGAGAEQSFGLRVSADGTRVAVVGSTASSDIPVTPNAYQSVLRGPSDAFVAELDGNGVITYLSYLGGGAHDWANGLTMDAAGRLVICGVTSSASFPVTPGCAQGSFAGNTDMFVTVLDPRLPGATQLVASTFLGGTGHEGVPYDLNQATNMSIGDLTLAHDGTVVVVGRTASVDFPISASAYQGWNAGVHADAFVTTFEPTLVARRYSTYLGGLDDDGAMAVAVDERGLIHLAGFSWSPGTSFPTTTGAPQRSLAGNNDGVLAVVDPGRSGAASLRYATLLGGAGVDYFTTLLVEDAGVITAAGTSGGGITATWGAFRSQPSPLDAVLLRLDPRRQGAADLHYLTYLGGPDGASETAVAIARNGDGLVTLAGYTTTTFPTTPGALQSAPGGQLDAFVCTLDLLPYEPGGPVGMTRHGTSSPGCRGPVWFQPNSIPAPGNARLAFLGNGAPRGSAGVFLLGTLPQSPARILNVDLLIDLRGASLVLPAVSTPAGAWQQALPLPPSLPGLPLFVQWIWAESSACGRGPLAASHAAGFNPQQP